MQKKQFHKITYFLVKESSDVISDILSKIINKEILNVSRRIKASNSNS